MEAGKDHSPKSGKSKKPARLLAWIFFCTSVCLSAALISGWVFVRKLALKPLAEPALPTRMQVSSGPASPLQIQYQLNMPGRGEIFPAFTGAQAADYWPVAVLNVSNTSNKDVVPV